MTILQTSVVPVRAVDTALRAAWSRLERDAVEPNPFFAPEVLLPAARHLPGGPDVRLVTVRRGAELVLALPVVLTRHRRVPLTAATTWRHAYRYVGTPLVLADALDDAPGAALAALGRLAPWFVMEQLYVDGLVAAAFRQAARRRGATWVEYDVWDRPCVHAPGQQPSPVAALSARSAKTLRRQRRGLEREFGGVRCSDAARSATPEVVRAEAAAFLALERAGWKGRAGTAMACDPGADGFFTQACQELAATGRLELWRLCAGDRVAARQVHVLAGDSLFHLKTTYDEALGKWSPGVQLELDVLAAFATDQRLTWIDPCTDDEPGTSARLYPARRRLGVTLVGLRPVGRVAARVTPWAEARWRAVQERCGRRPAPGRAGALLRLPDVGT